MIVAHVAGVPFEEMLLPLVSTAGVIFVAARAFLERAHRHSSTTEEDRT